MAAPRSTFAKRQKERARQERAAEKAQKRMQKKMDSQTPSEEETPKAAGNPVITYDEDGMPQALDFHDF